MVAMVTASRLLSVSDVAYIQNRCDDCHRPYGGGGEHLTVGADS